ncbi:MAG TPA: UDP-3-O-(3-hydroxymyristoyl)glucosamine N-acyltransferase [Candidatus Binatia bacterium]|nr:UDP-3-O-(3-hydroxymyristoyl)glucosamine N-acyltransferase [Candidatus Binatia bacterium]
MPTLGELAQRFGLELPGDPAVAVDGVCGIDPGQPGKLTFLANPRLRDKLAGTRAAAVIVGKADAARYAGPKLVARDPYLAFARVAALFDRSSEFLPGVHASAQVAPGVHVPASAHVGAAAVIEAGARVGESVFVGPGSIVGRDAVLGDGTRLDARVVIGERVQLGKRVRINPGAVIGSRGFGLARGPKGWEEVPQLGSVRIGDDVEVGANTTIDRGAVDDTVLEDGVKLDNLIQIAHNVRIGAHTAIAGCTGVAGSTRIGARCMIGGASTINGHIDIGDDVIVMGFTTVTKSLAGPGQYASSMWSVETAREWRRITARVRRLGRTEERLAALEKRLGIERQDANDDENA